MSQTTRTAGNSPISNLAMVQTDEVTLFGDGTPDRPLRADVGAQPFIADHEGATAAHVGQPVTVTDTVPTIGVTTVTAAPPGSPVAGVIITLNDDDSVTVLPCGITSMTTVQWDVVVTGGSGGLARGSAYYADPATPGKLTPTKPTASSTFVTRVGIGINPNTMLLVTPALTPTQN
jgi:hypothetical protein